MLSCLALILVLGAPVAGAAEPQTPEPAAEPQQAEDSPAEESQEASEDNGQKGSGGDGTAPEPPGDPGGQGKEKRQTPRGAEHPVDFFAGDCPRILDGDRRLFLKYVFNHLEDHEGRLPAVSGLPEPIKQLRRDLFVQIQEELGKCSATLSAKLAEKPTALIERAHDFLGEVDELLRSILDVYTREGRLRQRSQRLSSDLKTLRGLPVNPAEWPPADLCERCPGWLQELTTLIASVEDLAAGEGPHDRLGTALEAERTLRARISSLCQPARHLLTANLDEADRKARYYSWTETRRSFERVISVLSSKDLEYWCGR